jgi:hypothetical protein
MSTSNSRIDDELPTEEEPKTLKEAFRLLREDAKAKGTDKLTVEEIDEEIAAYRREQREQEQARK